ncbi:transcription antitermination factor NusB [Candidatus Parcubacteria bacterium]|nr:transcription antitermination factor NusB [Candidatus Parcubacteria bacterium]
MANRHLSRSIVMQSLFEWDSRGLPNEALPEVVNRNAEEFAPGGGDLSFMLELGANVLAKRPDLDLIIERAAPDWPIDKIAPVDRNILRIGLFELLFADRAEVPAKVAINEAIELAKTFGGENSGKFVNGVLGAVYKEIGEPGKDEVSKRKRKKIEDIPYEQMPIEKLVGAVVYAKEGDDVYLALVHDIFGHWTLSKGHVAENEDLKEGVVRVIKEEIDLPIVVEDKLGDNEYIASDPDKGKLRKQVTYYLAKGPFQNVTLQKTGGLDATQWFKLSDILNLNFYDDILAIVTKAINLLLKK